MGALAKSGAIGLLSAAVHPAALSDVQVVVSLPGRKRLGSLETLLSKFRLGYVLGTSDPGIADGLCDGLILTIPVTATLASKGRLRPEADVVSLLTAFAGSSDQAIEFVLLRGPGEPRTAAVVDVVGLEGPLALACVYRLVPILPPGQVPGSPTEEGWL